VSYFQKNVENVGATELSKVETKIHFKNGDKSQKCFNKNVERFCWEKNETKLTCFDFVVKKGKITLVWLEKPCLKITLKWLQGCQETNKK
jgi:hypothetical protein